MDMKAMFAALKAKVETLLRAKGYNTVNFVSLSFDGTRYSCVVEHMDDFQADLEAGMRVKSGYYNSYTGYTLTELVDEVSKLPSRSRREFEVMARRAAAMKMDTDLLISAAGKLFAEEITHVVEKYKLLSDV